jgi:hypothetical protein
MPARRVPALALPVDPKAGVSFRGYEHRTPLLTIATGYPALLVTLTLPEQLEAGHVEFARQLACQAWAYAVAVERRYRGLPALPGQPVPHLLAARPGTWTGDAARPDRSGMADRQEVTA